MIRIRRLAITFAVSAGLIAMSAEAASAAVNHCPPTRWSPNRWQEPDHDPHPPSGHHPRRLRRPDRDVGRGRLRCDEPLPTRPMRPRKRTSGNGRRPRSVAW